MIIVELLTRICTSIFFDPFPTVFHILLYLLIPASTLLVLLVQRQGLAKLLSLASALNGAAIGIAAWYTLIFLPLLPISLLAIIIMGLGFCGLSPLLGLLVTIRCRLYLTPLKQPPPRLWLGLALGLLAMMALETPKHLTMLGLDMAASDSTISQQRGIRLLRQFGNRKVMLLSCYENPRTAGMLTAGFLGIEPLAQTEEARIIYYRVTGKPFNEEPRPRITRVVDAGTRGFSRSRRHRGGGGRSRVVACQLADGRQH